MPLLENIFDSQVETKQNVNKAHLFTQGMATKRKSKSKTKTKKSLEAKIAGLERKLAKLSSKLEQKPAEQAKAAPPPPKPAEQAKAAPPPPKPAEQAKAAPPPPKPAEAPKPAPKEEAAPPVSLESLWASVSMGNWHEQKTKTPGYVCGNPRSWARRHATEAEAPTTPWSLQKSKIPGFTAPSNRYFATRQRLSYHPTDKKFTGYGVSLGHGAESGGSQTGSQKGVLPKGS